MRVVTVVGVTHFPCFGAIEGWNVISLLSWLKWSCSIDGGRIHAEKGCERKNYGYPHIIDVTRQEDVTGIVQEWLERKDPNM